MQTVENMATDLVEIIAKRATRGGWLDFNLAYAACMEVLLAYGDACATLERARCLAAIAGLYHGDACRAAIRLLDKED